MITPLELPGVVERSEIENVQWVVDAQRRRRRPLDAAVGVGRDRGEAHLIGRDERSIGDARLCALWRRRIVPNPRRQRGQQGPHGPELRIGIGLLLAIAERRVSSERQGRCAVLRACHDEGAHVWRIVDVPLAERVGQSQRLAAFPHFERRRDMEDARARIGRQTLVEQALRAPGQRIALTRIGERKIIGRIKMVGLLAPRAHRLPEANIERHQAPADMRVGAVEHPAAGLIGIEAEREETADHAAALRRALDNRDIVLAIDRVRRAEVVLRRIAQEGAEVAHCGEAEAADRRVLGAIDQFVEAARLKAGRIAHMLLVRRRRLARLAHAKAPFAIRDRRTGILLAGAHRQARQEAVRESGPIVQACGRIRIVAARRVVLNLLAEADWNAGRRDWRDHFRAHDASDRRAVVIVGDDRRHADPVHAGEHVHFPAEPNHRVSGAHEPAVSRRSKAVAIRDRSGDALVEGGDGELVAAVVDFEEQHAVAAREFGGLQEFDVGGIFDHAARIARREADVLDQRIGGIGRVKLAADAADEMNVSAGLAKGRAAKSRLALDDLDACDARLSPARQ